MATTTVSSGGVATQGGRTYLFGSSSGIDTSALVEVAYNARVAPADKIDLKVTANTAKKDAYNQMSTLAKAVQTSLANLKKSYGYQVTDPSTFAKRTGTLSSSNSTDPTKLLGVSIDSGTPLGSYQIEVIQKAKANSIGSNTTTDPTVALGYTGSFNIGVAGGATSPVNVTSTMTMNDLATAINATTTTSGVSATVLKISSSSYQLVLSGASTNKDIAISGVTGTNVMQSIGVLNGGGTAANVLQASQPAILKLNDIQITRDSNQIDDLITGAHLTINSAEPGTVLDMNIQNDTSSVKSDIMSFVSSYNALRDFIITNQAVSATGVAADDAVLFGDTFMKSLSSDMQSLIGGSYGNGGTDLSTLRELGITLDINNKMTVDETKLDDALLNKFDQVKNIFTTQITSNNSQFSVIANTSTQKSLSATINITVSGGAITGVSVGGSFAYFDVSGTSITGKKGTIYEGLTFAYVGTTNVNINFSMNQGVADLLTNTSNRYTDSLTGTITAETQRIDDVNKDIGEEATRIRERADDYREKLIDQYARYEAAIAQSKSVIAQLKAILGTGNNNN